MLSFLFPRSISSVTPSNVAMDSMQNQSYSLSEREKADLAVSNITSEKVKEITESLEYIRNIFNKIYSQYDWFERVSLTIKVVNDVMENHRLTLAVKINLRNSIKDVLKHGLENLRVPPYDRELYNRVKELHKQYFKYCDDLKSHPNYRSETDLRYPWNLEICSKSGSIIYKNMDDGEVVNDRPL